MITIERKKLEQALHELEGIPVYKKYGVRISNAIDAIKEALALTSTQCEEQPAPPPPECKTEAEQTAYAFGWWKALESVRTEPDWKDLFEKQKRRAEMWIAKYEKDIGPLEKAVPVAQEPRNFCPRCGKRTADLTVIHTCTPPEGGFQ